MTAWDILRDHDSPSQARLEAFETLLAVNHGWWGKGSLLQFVRRRALDAAKGALLRSHGSADEIDWEGLSNEALYLLFERASIIEHDPRSWLIGVIRNLAKREARRASPRYDRFDPEFTAMATDPGSPLGEYESEPTWARSLDLDKLFETLDPALRDVAILRLELNLSRTEICERLSISAPTLRKRIERLRRVLKQRAAARLPVSNCEPDMAWVGFVDALCAQPPSTKIDAWFRSAWSTRNASMFVLFLSPSWAPWTNATSVFYAVGEMCAHRRRRSVRSGTALSVAAAGSIDADIDPHSLSLDIQTLGLQPNTIDGAQLRLLSSVRIIPGEDAHWSCAQWTPVPFSTIYSADSSRYLRWIAGGQLGLMK